MAKRLALTPHGHPVDWIRSQFQAHASTIKALAWIFVLSRLFFEEIAGLAYVYLPHAWAEYPAGVLGTEAPLAYRVLIRMWAHWDGQWYLMIARQGYPYPQSTAFFPLYPMLVRYLGGSSVIGALAISWCATALAVVMLYRLVRLEFGDRVAWFSVLALLFFPTSFYTQAVYSEAIFLALAVSSLYYLRKGQYWWSGMLGGLASLTGIYGVFLAAPLAWTLWRTKGSHLKSLAPVVLIPAGVLLYMLYLTPHFLDPLVFEGAQKYWGRGTIALFLVTLWQGAVAAYHAAGAAISPQVLFQTGQPSQIVMNFYSFGFAVYALAIFVTTARWLPTYLLMYEGLALLLPLSYPSAGYPLLSLPRLILEAFPVFIGTGLLLDRYSKARIPYFVVSVLLAALFVSLFATSHWVA